MRSTIFEADSGFWQVRPSHFPDSVERISERDNEIEARDVPVGAVIRYWKVILMQSLALTTSNRQSSVQTSELV